MLSMLTEAVDEFVLTRVGMERSADPKLLANYLTDKVRHRVIEDSRLAFRSLFDGAQADEILLVAGSLYLLGEIHPMVQAVAGEAQPT